MTSNSDPGRNQGQFRFSSSEMNPYRGRRSAGARLSLFARWEAVGLLLLVPVGALFIPGVRGAPAVVTVLLDAAARGDLRARFFAVSPLLLALLFAWRAAGRLARPFAGYAAVASTATLSAVAAYVAFHLGLHLALRISGAWPWWSPWRATAPGAALGWIIILVVAAIRFLSRRTAATLEAARHERNEAETRPGRNKQEP